jgi:hypothetical protein
VREGASKVGSSWLISSRHLHTKLHAGDKWLRQLPNAFVRSTKRTPRGPFQIACAGCSMRWIDPNKSSS